MKQSGVLKLDKNKIEIEKLYVIVCALFMVIIGVYVGMLIEKPVAFEKGVMYQQGFYAGVYDSWQYETDLKYDYYIPTRLDMVKYSDHPYIKGWIYYNVTKIIRPSIVPVFGVK